MNALSDICFFIDIPLTFRTSAIDKNGETTFKAKEIAKIYLRGYFTIDFLSVIPLDLIGAIFLRGNTTQRLSFHIKVLPLLKLTRLFRINRIILMLMVHKDTKIKLKFFKLLFYIFFYGHLLGCYWFYYIKATEVWIHPMNSIWKDRSN